MPRVPAPFTSRVLIIGGGVIGVCCAYALARRGVSVVLLERDAIGRAASYGNAGTIACGHPPMNRPGRVTQAVRHMLDPTTPLYIAPRLDPVLARWLWTFSRHCTAERLDQNMRVLGPMGHASFAAFNRLIEEEALDCSYRADGYYEICRTERGLEGSHRDVALMRTHGYGAEPLSSVELRSRVAAVADGAVGGAHFPDAATCEPYRFVVEMADRAVRHGAVIRPGQAVERIIVERERATGVRTRAGDTVEADVIVLATGAYSLELVRPLGCRLPVQPGKGYHRDLEMHDTAPAFSAACVLSETSVFCTPMDGVLRLAGTMEFSGLNHVLRRPRLEQLTTAAARYLDGIDSSRIRWEWCGLRPCTPDGLPIVSRLPGHADVLVATGHAMAGLTLGPVTGSLVADLVLGVPPAFDISALEAARFG